MMNTISKFISGHHKIVGILCILSPFIFFIMGIIVVISSSIVSSISVGAEAGLAGAVFGIVHVLLSFLLIICIVGGLLGVPAGIIILVKYQDEAKNKQGSSKSNIK